MARPKRKKKIGSQQAESYKHPEATSPMRPDVGTQAQFKKKKPPRTYRYDSSLSPALEWDGQNAARELGETQLAALQIHLRELHKVLGEADTTAPKDLQEAIERLQKTLAAGKLPLAQADEAVRKLIALSRPFLNWAGKAERLSFDVPTLPLFIHERLSTKAIIETLTGHRKAETLTPLFDLFGDPQHPIADQVLKAYEYPDKWVNRMILGDSLVAMNSVLGFEGLGGQVQMIYMDPPYGIKYGSNFQPFVRKRDVTHNDDADLTREPEMVQAYRDTWEIGLHSYLTYMRDRLLLCRELLAPSGSVFVQISDENVHHVREVMDEVFGPENFCSQIAFRKTTGKGSELLDATYDNLLWYAKDRQVIRFRRTFSPRRRDEDTLNYRFVELPDSTQRAMTKEELSNIDALSTEWRVFAANPLTSQTASATTVFEFKYQSQTFRPGKGGWKTNIEGMENLRNAHRLMAIGNTLRFIRYVDDFPFQVHNDIWDDTRQSGFGDQKVYVVQTGPAVIQRCLLMTTDPGDLVLDPTCGSGTTAYVAEQWGRRWITADVSRVPLALARQRLLTATFPWYELKDEERGPAGGFVYKRKQNKKGEEVGGIVPHVTLKSIANNEPPAEEVLVDRPETVSGITRVTGPFTVEGIIPTTQEMTAVSGASPLAESAAETSIKATSWAERMLEVLRKSPILRLEGNKTVTFTNVRPPAKSLMLSAEALVDATAPGQNPSLADAVQESVEKSGQALPFSQKPVAFVFGPESGAVSDRIVFEAAREAYLKNYSHLYVIGFAIQANARKLVDSCTEVVGVPATYVQATPDLLMGDLLKNLRSSQIFSVCGSPEIKVHKKNGKNDPKYQVELLGLDVFDPVTMEVDHRGGNDVPAWLLDTDYNGLCFHVSQAFFPRTAAWDNLKRALRATHEESVWDHLAGTLSAPFEAGEHNQVAVKVIDDRGNELLVVQQLGGKEK